MATAMKRGFEYLTRCVAAVSGHVNTFSFPILKKTTIQMHQLSFLLESCKNTFFEDDKIPTIPPQEKPKATIIFDFKNFLTYDRYSLSRFDFITQRRSFCEEFLYNLINHYELISITDSFPTESSHVLPRLDPFGCITYRLCVYNKKHFLPLHLNRPLERVVILSTENDEFSKTFNDNIIRLPRWKGGTDTTLMDLVHFFNNMRFSNLKDYRPTIKSYQNTDFIRAFRNVQERLYNHRSMLSSVSFIAKLAEVNNRKLNEYAEAKKNMEEVKKSESITNYSVILGFIRSVIL
ncbi:mitochondrial import inner membrane translocase subunit TIM50 [Pancytospora epiphaga]|nr:mitochondrial import inner membrane translocase subunit TIM50 [Pancytospora epiphaga]